MGKHKLLVTCLRGLVVSAFAKRAGGTEFYVRFSTGAAGCLFRILVYLRMFPWQLRYKRNSSGGAMR